MLGGQHLRADQYSRWFDGRGGHRCGPLSQSGPEDRRHRGSLGAGTNNTGVLPQYGQSMVPGDLTNVVAIAAGAYHSLALKGDGSLVAWGYNATGQTNVPGGLSNVVAVAAGFTDSLALKADGTVVAWGDNSYGQTNIPAGLANAVQIAGGGYHNLALENDGQPSLTVQPVGQATAAGMTVQLQAMAVGVQPLSYQWRTRQDEPGGGDQPVVDSGERPVLRYGRLRAGRQQLTGHRDECIGPGYSSIAAHFYGPAVRPNGDRRDQCQLHRDGHRHDPLGLPMGL